MRESVHKDVWEAGDYMACGLVYRMPRRKRWWHLLWIRIVKWWRS